MAQSLMAQGTEFPLRKPPGFHWDFFLLGVTTFIAGLLGVPAPNGLIPQAPIHTASLVVTGKPQTQDEEKSGKRDEDLDDGKRRDDELEVPVAVVEQRVSNLAQGSLCLVLLTGPFLHVLNLVPRGVLAGLLYVFFLMPSRCVLINRFLQLVHGCGRPARERYHAEDAVLST